MDIEATDALIVVDVQNDFCPGGALAVADGDAIIPLINAMTPRFATVVFTRDWHPANHCSFSDAPEFVDGSWPVHCVADSPGAALHADLNLPEGSLFVNKGADPAKEAYSDFEETDLADQLRKRSIKRLVVCGLATDYCVKATALDGLKHGFDVAVVQDACRAVDVPAGTGRQALDELAEAGATLCTAKDVAR